jgi:hypothetical protein
MYTRHWTRPTYVINVLQQLLMKEGVNDMSAVKDSYYPVYTSTAVILVLYILLVIILRTF